MMFISEERRKIVPNLDNDDLTFDVPGQANIKNNKLKTNKNMKH